MAENKNEIKYNGISYVIKDDITGKLTNIDNVNSPAHYKQGNRETIEVIKDYMTNDEFAGYLKGNIIKYVGRFKFKGNPLQDLKKANWYLNKLINEVETWVK